MKMRDKTRVTKGMKKKSSKSKLKPTDKKRKSIVKSKPDEETLDNKDVVKVEKK